MPRFLDESGTKFWEIERDGATIVRRNGKVGSKGRTQTRTFANAMLARWNYGNFVGYKTHTEKYRAEVAPVPRPTDEFPATDEARLVHADALQAQGDPFGELIVLQHAMREARDDAVKGKLGRRIEELLSANELAWFGDLACARSLFYFGWHLGRLRRARLRAVDDSPWFHTIRHDVLPEVPACYMLGGLLEALFDLPIARSLEALDVGTVGTVDYQHTTMMIVQHAPPTLRRLALYGDGVQAEAVLAPMQFPALEEFVTDLSLSTAGLTDVANATWPNLRELTFTISASVITTLTTLAPLLSGSTAPQLRKLDIGITSPSTFCRALAEAPLVGDLEQLVIRHGTQLDPEARDALLESAPFARFARLV